MAGGYGQVPQLYNREIDMDAEVTVIHFDNREPGLLDLPPGLERSSLYGS